MKKTLEEVQQYFEDQNCELLETVYVNNRTPMEYKCCCGNISVIRLDNFQQGKRCKTCRYKKSAESNRHSYEYIKKCFKENNCELLSKEYKNGTILLDYICECKNVSKICFNNFNQGQRCSKCKNKKIGDAKRHSFEYIKQFFLENDCELLESSYINNRSPLKYKCSCGNESTICFEKFQIGQRCMKCSSITEKHTFEYVYDFFAKNNCVLLSTEYINNTTLMDYECECGNSSKIKFCDFHDGVRCNNCIPARKIRTSLVKFGTPHPMQNAEISEKSFHNALKSKEYTFPSGKVEKVQGYENFAVDILLNSYTEQELKLSRIDVPEIWYEFKGKTRRYFADIYIPKDNLVIEVKSEYTYNKNRGKNICKALFTRKRGYNFELWILHKCGNVLYKI